LQERCYRGSFIRIVVLLAHDIFLSDALLQIFQGVCCYCMPWNSSPCMLENF